MQETPHVHIAIACKITMQLPTLQTSTILKSTQKNLKKTRMSLDMCASSLNQPVPYIHSYSTVALCDIAALAQKTVLITCILMPVIIISCMHFLSRWVVS